MAVRLNMSGREGHDLRQAWSNDNPTAYLGLDIHPDAHDQYIRKVDAEHEQLIWTHPGMTPTTAKAGPSVFGDAMAVRGLPENRAPPPDQERREPCLKTAAWLT
ncbi:hypothetical protein [Bradyrhizobium lablabi]|uniref:hypothetical protein n=1 Tax=Bradyrhizobium lablabi TaxID=722472 RepID=UPI0020112E2C|nr:hypothetical protein [Bradyrhizobium lablabi]